MNLKVKSIKQILCIFLSIFIFLFSGFTSLAGEAVNQGNSTLLLPKSEQRIHDAKDLAAFMEEFWSKFKRANIPGMVFAVVNDGKIIFSQGYGYTDREEKLPVNPEKTLFRLGPIPKKHPTYPNLTDLPLYQVQEHKWDRFDDIATSNHRRFTITLRIHHRSSSSQTLCPQLP